MVLADSEIESYPAFWGQTKRHHRLVCVDKVCALHFTFLRLCWLARAFRAGPSSVTLTYEVVWSEWFCIGTSCGDFGARPYSSLSIGHEPFKRVCQRNRDYCGLTLASSWKFSTRCWQVKLDHLWWTVRRYQVDLKYENEFNLPFPVMTKDPQSFYPE